MRCWWSGNSEEAENKMSIIVAVMLRWHDSWAVSADWPGCLCVEEAGVNMFASREPTVNWEMSGRDLTWSAGHLGTRSDPALSTTRYRQRNLSFPRFYMQYNCAVQAGTLSLDYNIVISGYNITNVFISERGIGQTGDNRRNIWISSYLGLGWVGGSYSWCKNRQDTCSSNFLDILFLWMYIFHTVWSDPATQ